MNPLVSVIVPNYNHANFLQQRLDTIYNQTYKNIEVILLDDASSDKSLEILNKYASHPKTSKCIFSKENSGSPFVQWLKGIAVSQGEYVWIAESDDYSSPFFLENIISFINKTSTNPGLIYSQTQDVDKNNQIISDRINYTKSFSPNIWETEFEMNGREFIKNYLNIKNVIPNASAVVFKKDLVKENTFNEELLSMRMAGDWFLWIKLLIRTNIGFIPQYLNFFRDHKDVTRVHDTVPKILQRISEERIIRLYLKNELRIDQYNELDQIYIRWFKVHSFFSLFDPKFYRPKPQGISLFGYINLFIKYKLAKYTKRIKIIFKS